MLTRAVWACVCLLGLLLQSSFSYSQALDHNLLEDLRKRYKDSFESIYVNDSALNNLSVHLRNDKNVEVLTQHGANPEALSLLRKFLLEMANDRAFLQLQLRALRAGFKKGSDLSATIQQLPWTDRQVLYVAVVCDRYLQGQWNVSELKRALMSGQISVADSWKRFDQLRRDPYVPPVTIADPLTDFAAYAQRNEAQVNALAGTNPFVFNQISRFKSRANDNRPPEDLYFAFEWPTSVKSEWARRYKALESYGQSTDAALVPSWRRQMDFLQDLQFAQMVRSTPSPTP